MKNQNQPVVSSQNYQVSWQDQDYEHLAEVMAIRRLLEGKYFREAVDIGGGDIKLSRLLLSYTPNVTIVVPTKHLYDTTKMRLDNHKGITLKQMSPRALQFPDHSIECITMIRIMHRLVDPTPEFKEIRRLLTDNGYALIEVANFMHIRNRMKYLVQRKKLPTEPMDIRPLKQRKESGPSYVNHNPRTVIKQLAHAGLKVERILSVANLKSPILKKVLPQNVVLAIEGILQPTLTKAFLGPSIFLLIRKAS